MPPVQRTFAFGLEQDEECAICQPIPQSVAIKKYDHIFYLNFLADMFSTLRKINETESTSVNACYIPRFKVPMHYSNTMKIFHQPVHLKSGASYAYQHEGNHLL